LLQNNSDRKNKRTNKLSKDHASSQNTIFEEFVFFFYILYIALVRIYLSQFDRILEEEI